MLVKELFKMASELKTYEMPAWLAAEKQCVNPLTGIQDKETEKAVRLQLPGPNVNVWLPKSQIKEVDNPPKEQPKPKVAASAKTVNIAVRTNGKYCAEDCPMLEDPIRSCGCTMRYCKIFTESEAQEDGLYQDDTGNWRRSWTCRKACGDEDTTYE